MIPIVLEKTKNRNPSLWQNLCGKRNCPKKIATFAKNNSSGKIAVAKWIATRNLPHPKKNVSRANSWWQMKLPQTICHSNTFLVLDFNHSYSLLKSGAKKRPPTMDGLSGFRLSGCSALHCVSYVMQQPIHFFWLQSLNETHWAHLSAPGFGRFALGFPTGLHCCSFLSGLPTGLACIPDVFAP